MDRHDGEKLLDGPAIGHALEQRKITEIGIGKKTVEPFELLRKIVELLAELLNIRAYSRTTTYRRAGLRKEEQQSFPAPPEYTQAGQAARLFSGRSASK